MAILPHLTFFRQSDARLRADAFRMYQLVFCWYRPRRASLADSFKNLRTPVILFALNVLNTVTLNAQWELRYPEIPIDQINDITFLNQSIGFFVNSAGSVWMTTDGGTSWKVKAHYQRDVISEIKFLDDRNGFAISPHSGIGDDVTFIYTTDGGLHWSPGNVSMVDALAFLPISGSAVIKSNASGSIRKLDNFYGLWTETYRTPFFFDIDLWAPYGNVVKFQRLPAGKILALGSSDWAKRARVISDSVTFLLKSDDVGTTWDTLWCGLPYSSQTFSFFDDSLGWLGSESDRIYATTDGGKTWILQYSDTSQNSSIKSVCSPDGIVVHAVDGSGRVLSSSDRGSHWQFIQIDQYYDYPFTIRFLNSAKGFLAGPDFWVTTDGARSWKRVSGSIRGTLRKIDFASANVGMGVGGHCIYKTSDGGYGWNILYDSPTEYFSGVDMLDTMHVWVTSSDSVYKSTNGGNSWNAFQLSSRIEYMRGIQFLDLNTGIIYEVQETDSTYNYVTTDGGNNWNRYSINNIQYFSSFNKVKFTDAGHLWFANQYGAWLSRDTAKTWTLFPVDGANWAFDFADSLNGWISIWGGQFKRMAHTTNGGTTWEFVDRPYASQTEDVLAFRGVNYSSRVDVYAAGYEGSLTHFIQDDPFVYDIATYTGNALFSFASVREGNTLHVWLAGEGMTVLHYIAFVTGVQIDGHEVPATYFLSQNYPNPFNPSTNISFSLPRSANVRLTVIDLLGREVAILVDNEERSAGNYTVAWNAASFASGVYFYRLQAGGFVQTKKLVLLK